MDESVYVRQWNQVQLYLINDNSKQIAQQTIEDHVYWSGGDRVILIMYV